MPEHLIRLRGGWEAWDLSRPASEPSRASLPLAGPVAASRNLKLVRRFGRPPLETPAQRIAIRLDHVPGLVSLRLNGKELQPLSPVDGPWEVPAEDLLARNELELQVELPDPLPGPWGDIALVIRESVAPTPPLGATLSDR